MGLAEVDISFPGNLHLLVQDTELIDVKQNEWLRQNVFDSFGNYLYCFACVCSALGVSKDRLTRQRNIKRQNSQQPIVEMKKCEVEEKRLGDYVIMPANVEASLRDTCMLKGVFSKKGEIMLWILNSAT